MEAKTPNVSKVHMLFSVVSGHNYTPFFHFWTHVPLKGVCMSVSVRRDTDTRTGV